MHKKSFRQICVLLLSVALICTMFPVSVFAEPDDGMKTLDYYGIDGSVKSNQECISVTQDDTTWTEGSLTSGWYVHDGGYFTINTRIEVKGDVNLILASDAPFFVTDGIHVGPDSSLTIWDATIGTYHGVQVTSCCVEGVAAIGGNRGEVNGPITINGGHIVAQTNCSYGQLSGAGIGTGTYATGTPGTITINRAEDVVAKSFPGGAGIGGGYMSNSGKIIINDGQVSANGNDGAAGIGGGTGGIITDTITINGGKVTAKGGHHGSGIGSGQIRNDNTAYANHTLIRIHGGEVIAVGGEEGGNALVQAEPGINNGLFYSQYSIYEEAKVLVSNIADSYTKPDTLALDTKDCAKYSHVEIIPCSHTGGTRYIPLPGGHSIACDSCRYIFHANEEHIDANNDNVCDTCGSVIDASYTVTFDSDGGSEVSSQSIHVNDIAICPETPTKPGCSFLGWTLNGEVYDFRTPITGDITLVAVWDEAYVATIVSATVMFKSQLQLRFTFRFSDELMNDPAAEIKFTKRGKVIHSCKLSQYDSANEDGYQYCVSVAPAEWRDYITVEVYNGDNEKMIMRNVKGQAKENNEIKYSYYEYFANYYSSEEAGVSTNYDYLIRDGLFYYCQIAQAYFNYGGDRPIDSDIVISEPYTNENLDEQYRLRKTGTKPSGLSGTSTVLDFKSNNTLRVIFSLTGDRPVSDFDFELKDCEGNIVTTEVIPLSDTRYALQTEGLDAPNLSKTFSFTITDKSDGTSYTVHASAMSYAILAVEKGSTDYMKYLGKALYMYGYYARECFEG